MRITLLVVGKTTDPHFAAGIEEYARRIRHYLPFDMEVVPELRNTKSLSEEQQKEKEADLLLKAFQPGDHIVLLDEHGREYRSVEFAAWMEKKKISLSRMTFSHQMIRLIFAEQIYRAQTILHHEPYHHE